MSSGFYTADEYADVLRDNEIECPAHLAAVIGRAMFDGVVDADLVPYDDPEF